MKQKHLHQQSFPNKVFFAVIPHCAHCNAVSLQQYDHYSVQTVASLIAALNPHTVYGPLSTCTLSPVPSGFSPYFVQWTGPSPWLQLVEVFYTTSSPPKLPPVPLYLGHFAVWNSPQRRKGVKTCRKGKCSLGKLKKPQTWHTCIVNECLIWYYNF